jgi:hypothetical protein
VTAAGRQIATSGVMTAVRLRVVVPAVRTATTVPQRAMGRVPSAAGMAPHVTAASVPTTGTRRVTGVPPVTEVRDRILPPIGLPVAGRRGQIPALIGPSVTVVRGRIPAPIGLTVVRGRIPALIGPSVTGALNRILPLIGQPAGAVRMARRRGLPGVGPGIPRRNVTLAATALPGRPVGVTETAGRNARPPDGSGPERGTEAVPEAR